MREIHKLIRNLFLAHKAAREAIKGIDGAALVGSNPLQLGLPPFVQWIIDWLVTYPSSPKALINQGKRFAEGSWLSHGSADLVAATFAATRPRAQHVSFSEVYHVAAQRLLVKRGSEVRGANDLSGRAVAVLKTSSAANRAPELLPGAHVRWVTDFSAARAALDGGQVEAILADDTILEGVRRESPDRYRLVGERLTSEPYAIAVKPGDRELLDHVNAALKRVREYQPLPPAELGPPEAATAVSIGGSQLAQVARDRLAAGGPLPLAEPGTALRRIQDRGYLVAAVRDDVPGFGFRDPRTGQYSGLEIELAREVARQILGDPAKVEFRATTTTGRIQSVRSFWGVFDPILKPLSALSTIFYANWWHLGMVGKLPEALCPRECAHQQDFVGIDYYWGIRSLRLSRILALLRAANRRYAGAPVWPGGLYWLLHHHARLFPGKPILVLENGSVDVADGMTREEYVRDHLRQVQRALSDRVPVKGYICWSITSNREWGAAFGENTDFGLYHIDLDRDPRLARVQTDAARAYQEIIRQRSAY